MGTLDHVGLATPVVARAPDCRERARRVADVAALLCGILAAVAVYAVFAPLPAAQPPASPVGTVVVAADGTILWRDTTDGLRIPVPLARVSPAMRDATIAAEDERFRSHPGVDPIAIVRAAVRLPWERSGASTITQQFARGAYLQEGGFLPLRKAREALIATQLDARLSKDEILERYLNATYYGRGAYGVEAASRVYFGVSAANLDIAQAAYLAGLPQNPAVGDEAGAPALDRQRYVLDRLVATGKIDRTIRASVLAAPPQLLETTQPPIAPHFVDLARAERERVAPDLAGRDGLVIETTLDAGLQAIAETRALLQLDRLERNDAHNAAVVVLDPRDGRILAMAGNATRDPDGADFNMAITPRQPGSALKPFLYALALQRGQSAASPLLDVPSTFDTRHGGYAPQNYDLTFRGIVTLRTALASSLNVPAVATLADLGVQPFVDELRRLGITTLTDVERYDLALALGAGEVTLLQLSAAYGVLANDGAHVEPFAIARVRDSSGKVLYERPAVGSRPVLPGDIAFLISDILADPAARVPGFGRGSALELPFPAAVKTGTTTDFRDNWTVGYTSAQVVGVWVGNTDNAPMRDVSGVAGAAPIWAEMMTATRSLQGDAAFVPSPTLTRVDVCTPTGLLPGDACPSVRSEWFIAGAEPRETERYYTRDDTGRTRIDPPAAARPWLRDGGYSLVDESLALAPRGLEIVQPAPGAVLYLAPELSRQELVIRIGCPPGSGEVTVFADGEEVARHDSCLDRIVTPLQPGTHQLRIEVRLSNGQLVEARSDYEVRTQ